ncbi:MAG: bifunctional metallophosphatase/5'-nucleotidase [Lachnospiraceae bacterium]|nr:bifunctional metallophosphatase/5'-nucleotidase [Lachnospiraceae bacterium]
MKRAHKRLIAIIIVAALVITGVGTMVGVALADNKKSVDIVFTSDMHSNLNSFVTPYKDNPNANIGGFARVATIVNQQKAANPDTFYFDGGDFSMGTLFHTLYEKEACELRLLGMMGCDATTWGNHEFNFGSEGVINMLNAAMNSGDKLPQMVVCNIDWSNPGDEQATKDVFDKYGIKKYTMIEKGGVKVAVLGVFGDNALDCEPTCTVNFQTGEGRIKAVQETVKEIKANEDADMIVCLSHSGLDGEVGKGKTEDEVLAQKVPELDFILAGHSHTELDKPLTYGNTHIVACGEYTEAVGLCNLVQNSNGRWDVNSYELKNTYESVPSDSVIQDKINGFEKLIDSEYLAQFGLTKNQVLAQSAFDFCSMDAISQDHQGQNLGDLMSDAYLYAARQAEPNTKFDMGVVPSGTIRGTYTKGDITTDNVFTSFSLGIGPDKVPGYPLVKVYLTGAEMKTAAEIDASVSDLFAGTRLYMSGEEFTYNPNRLLLNKVTEVKFVDQNGNKSDFEDDKLYCVVADLYSGQMLGSVTDASYGLLKLVPKDENGNEITDFNKAIIYDANGKEVKAWDAIATYMQSFDKNEQGISQVPEKYRESQGRKIRDDNSSIGAIISSPNWFTFLVLGIVLVVIALVVLIILLIIYIIKRIYYGKNYKRMKEQKKERKLEKKMAKKMGK